MYSCFLTIGIHVNITRAQFFIDKCTNSTHPPSESTGAQQHQISSLKYGKKLPRYVELLVGVWYLAGPVQSDSLLLGQNAVRAYSFLFWGPAFLCRLGIPVALNNMANILKSLPSRTTFFSVLHVSWWNTKSLQARARLMLVPYLE
jgi:hypothetical protein